MALNAPKVRVVLEYADGDTHAPTMHWERTASRSAEQSPMDTFELLGRAFEVAQREENAAFADALQAFFKGALISKGDVAGVLAQME